MITVLRLGGTGELAAVIRYASLFDAVAVAAAFPSPGSSFLIDGCDVARLAPPAGGSRLAWCLVEATGYQIIWLHDAVVGAKELYRFATRPLALPRLLSALEERHPAPEEVESLPMIQLSRYVKEEI